MISAHGTVTKVPDQTSYSGGTGVDLTATAAAGWSFVNWTGYACADPVNPVCTVTMDADVVITANYSPDNPTISGNAGVGGATINYAGSDGGVTTADVNGNYTFTVLSKPWTGTVTPSKFGYTFVPASRSYTAITLDQGGQNYIATAPTFTISGNISGNLAPNTGVGGVTLSYTDGTPKTVNTNSLGNYTLTVSYGWTGTVTPSRTGVIFTPANIPYTNVTANQILQNYVRQAPTFGDVPFTYSETLGGVNYQLFPYIQALYNAGFTAGCQTTPSLYSVHLIP